MDPTETVKRMKELAARILNHTSMTKGNGLQCDAEELAELTEALDEWLVKYGSIPEQWAHQERRAFVAAR